MLLPAKLLHIFTLLSFKRLKYILYSPVKMFQKQNEEKSISDCFN